MAGNSLCPPGATQGNRASLGEQADTRTGVPLGSQKLSGVAEAPQWWSNWSSGTCLTLRHGRPSRPELTKMPNNQRTGCPREANTPSQNLVDKGTHPAAALTVLHRRPEDQGGACPFTEMTVQKERGGGSPSAAWYLAP